MSNPTKFTLGQASKETGKSKGTLSRDIKSGKISAERMPDGSFQIDASELFRVYDRVDPEHHETGFGNPSLNDPQPHESPNDTAGLAAQLRFIREQMAMADRMHEKELNLLNDRIEELRQDREDLRGERDSLLKTLQEQAMSVRLLTDQSRPIITPPPSDQPPAAPPPAAPPSAPGGGFFGLFRRRAA